MSTCNLGRLSSNGPFTDVDEGAPGAVICTHNGIGVEDFYWKWEAANMQMTPRVLNKASLVALKEYLEAQAFKLRVQRKATATLNGPQSRNLLSMVRGTKIKSESKTAAGPSLTKDDLPSGRSCTSNRSLNL